ncbi:GntR family transcriptional regulator [Actinocatenispora rupis]|uniref:GntR family transcriptional regulator n=1 Tax=Actinocatenispora rupis TaxID=519421 RepID=A0A8J3J8L3_9ACTN|nr:GntR family transcriptional regulator [Actinocatenispora rupis]GID15998.1 GntR family transcriptional regulator [Actinocatenispora rupis]
MAYEPRLSKYAEIVSALQRRIEDGTYQPGTLLPSQSQLATEFGVSQQTAVRALNILKQDGHIEGRQGKGYVVRGRPSASRRGAPEYIDNLLSADEAASELLGVDAILASPRIASVLKVKEHSAVFARRRLITGEDGPIALSTAYMPVQVAIEAGLDSPEPMAGSLRTRIEAARRTRFDFVIESVTARLPTDEEAERLKMETASAVLWLLITAYAPDGSALVALEVVLPGSLHELTDTYGLTS